MSLMDGFHAGEAYLVCGLVLPLLAATLGSNTNPVPPGLQPTAGSFHGGTEVSNSTLPHVTWAHMTFHGTDRHASPSTTTDGAHWEPITGSGQTNSN